ncbi:hypothetical protein pipiens_013445 [Culex pipiens pipiens]|uniref:Uncharacterized protein n=1 Tax=Culex pipiens pipiens TaxID=38569 RepID=A0ABD1CZK0_CULPP
MAGVTSSPQMEFKIEPQHNEHSPENTQHYNPALTTSLTSSTVPPLTQAAHHIVQIYSAEEQQEMEYDDYEEKEYLRDPVDSDFDPFADQRVDTESTETYCGKDRNGSEDDRGKEVHEKGEPS